MIHETDLPCSACGAGRFERSLDVPDFPFPTGQSKTVTIAECPRCGARYYPEETLPHLRGTGNDTHRGDS